MLKIAVVDNDKEVLDFIEDYLSLYKKENNLDYSLSKFNNELEFLDFNGTFDVLFLDMNMPFKNGMEVARDLRARGDNVVICILTNYSQYAISGYEVNAFDFILKNQPYEVYKIHFKRIFDYAETFQNKSISINSKYKKIKLNVDDILFVESKGHSLIFYTQKELIESWGSFSEIGEKLKEISLIRCHESFFINPKKIKEVKKEYVIIGENQVPISRSRKKDFLLELRRFI